MTPIELRRGIELLLYVFEDKRPERIQRKEHDRAKGRPTGDEDITRKKITASGLDRPRILEICRGEALFKLLKPVFAVEYGLLAVTFRAVSFDAGMLLSMTSKIFS